MARRSWWSSVKKLTALTLAVTANTGGVSTGCAMQVMGKIAPAHLVCHYRDGRVRLALGIRIRVLVQPVPVSYQQGEDGGEADRDDAPH